MDRIQQVNAMQWPCYEIVNRLNTINANSSPGHNSAYHHHTAFVATRAYLTMANDVKFIDDIIIHTNVNIK